MSKQEIYAYGGKILRIDLTSTSISYEPTINYAKEWLGGSGIGQWILYNEVKPKVTPYSPANRIVFGAGPLVGTLAPGSSRLSADSINGLTLGIGSSNCDSHFALELKYAGYDQIICQGKASKPVYIWIDNGNIEIRDASHIWGKTTWETVDLIREELGDDGVHLISIGPAGENIVRTACIIQDKGRALGRCGLGGIMGSKNLKAIAVRGSGAIAVAQPERFIRAVDAVCQNFANSKYVAENTRLGSIGGVFSKQEDCGIPYKNFQYTTLPDDIFHNINPDDIQRSYRVRNLGYPSCPVCCSRCYQINNGPFAGLTTEGFQLEALVDFAGKLAISDPSFLIKINAYCNQLGIDIDGVAGSIAWAMECYQRGILKDNDADGLKLEWGDAAVIIELTRRIAYREGFGNILAEGCALAAEIFGRDSSYYAMHIKGQDLYESIRGDIGWGLGCCTSTRGGGHVTGTPLYRFIHNTDEITRTKVYGFKDQSCDMDYKGKAEQVYYFERLHRINNSLGVCHYCTNWVGADLPGFTELAELYSSATGWETTPDDLRKAATRMLNVEKAFNLLHTDFNRKDDYPTPRDLAEPIPDGIKKGWQLNKKKWDKLLDEYYQMNGWDKKTGFPTRKCLQALELQQVADDLKEVNKLRIS